jgi:hypothetical protein
MTAEDLVQVQDLLSAAVDLGGDLRYLEPVEWGHGVTLYAFILGRFDARQLPY